MAALACCQNCFAPQRHEKFSALCSSKPDAKLEKGLRGFRAITLWNVFPNGTTTVFGGHVPRWKRSRLNGNHVGAEMGGWSVSNCRPWRRTYFNDTGSGRKDRRVDLDPRQDGGLGPCFFCGSVFPAFSVCLEVPFQTPSPFLSPSPSKLPFEAFSKPPFDLSTLRLSLSHTRQPENSKRAHFRAPPPSLPLRPSTKPSLHEGSWDPTWARCSWVP